ncbi:MAG: hypothetical protein Q9174_001966 [Haloplaca sp. 1 TL-2023]
MSATAAPISPERFAEALVELPIGNLHSKAAEMRNAIAHLVSSNQQLRQYANDGDQDCADAIKENDEVIERMHVRIGLLKTEVENRGLPWGDDEPVTVNGKVEVVEDAQENAAQNRSQTDSSSQPARATGGTLGDEELARRLRAQMEEDDNGVHL